MDEVDHIAMCGIERPLPYPELLRCCQHSRIFCLSSQMVGSGLSHFKLGLEELFQNIKEEDDSVKL